MKSNIEVARQYLHNMMRVVGDHLISSDGVYSGRDGHLRFARECGYALNDFDEYGRAEILNNSYDTVYAIGCQSQTILNRAEWVSEMSRQVVC